MFLLARGDRQLLRLRGMLRESLFDQGLLAQRDIRPIQSLAQSEVQDTRRLPDSSISCCYRCAHARWELANNQLINAPSRITSPIPTCHVYALDTLVPTHRTPPPHFKPRSNPDSTRTPPIRPRPIYEFRPPYRSIPQDPNFKSRLPPHLKIVVYGLKRSLRS